MRDDEEALCYNIAEEIFPNINIPKQALKKKFGLILTGKSTLAACDIMSIAERVGYAPLFFVISRKSGLYISRMHARFLGARVILPRTAAGFCKSAFDCAFNIAESTDGMLISFLSGIPTYYPSESRECGKLAKELISLGAPSSHLIGYERGKSSLIGSMHKELTDFSECIRKLRGNIAAKLGYLI